MRLIRKAALLTLLSLLIPALWVTTAWADVWDPCDSTGGPGSYQNLAAPNQNYINWSDPPDRSYLCQQSNQRTASAVYRCSNAQEVTVAIYSRYGSYAGYSGGELVRGGDELPLRYQASTGEVYCDGRRMVYDNDRRGFVFLEEEGRPSGLTEYGLSIYCSEDGWNYARVSTQLLSAWREGPDAYWYEEYRADLEEGTRFVRLVLTDQSSIEILGREERYQFETTGGLSLAWVEIIEDESGEDNWEEGSYRSSAGNGGVDYDWEDWENWAEDGSATGGLPSYQPGEEEGPESLPWGPDEDPGDGRPAFPEETGDREEEQGLVASSQGGSSSGGGSASSSKAQSRQKTSSGQKGQGGASGEPSGEKPPAAVETGAPTPALRREVPLWRRVMEPDAMSMIIIALTLVVMGIRILCEDGGSRRRYGRTELPTEQEERYARYMSPGSHPREDPKDPEGS